MLSVAPCSARLSSTVPRRGVLGDVVERFLDDPEAGVLDVTGQAVVEFRRAEIDLEVRRLAQSIDVPAQGGDQPEIVEHRRPQADRDVAHHVDDVLDRADAAGDRFSRRTLRLLNGVEAKPRRGQGLTDIVVEFVGDAPRFFVLDLGQTLRGPGEVRHAFRAPLKILLFRASSI